MIELRIKECCKEHGITQKELAGRLGVKEVSFSQMVARKGFSVTRLGEIADAIGCNVSELFAEPKGKDFAAFVRCKGIHFTADSFEEFQKIVEQIKEVAK